MKLTIKDMTLIGLFVALMIAGAFIKIPNPLYPAVPLTFQLFFSIYAGLLLSSRNAFYSQLIYVLLGLMGLPVFAYGGGLGYLFNPTFGYIIGFLISATLIGSLTKKQIGQRSLLIATIGYLIIYSVGNTYMYLILHLYLKKEITWFALSITMLPYMIKDYVLVILAVLSSMKIIPAIKKAGY